MRNFHDQFESLTSLKMKLIDAFGELVPSTIDFQTRYFWGKQSTKFWIMCQDDLNAMYKCLHDTMKGNILLWCDARSSATGTSTQEVQPSSGNRKRKSQSDPPVSKRQQTEDDVEETVKGLKEKHGTKFTMPLLRLWARMIAAGNHESMEDPPKIPAITGITPKREKRESLADAISHAAMTFADAFQPKVQMASANNSLVINQTTPPKLPSTSRVGLSPGRITELRVKKLQELRELQRLLEENILSEEEFTEQKSLVLDSLRKLVH